ncbi:MAG: GNAT family N-acetyltransferase [Succinivibrionaceae bacterium]|nr:GNAT family N-acetyltransferase [Succinivibrionaceae bacterium]
MLKSRNCFICYLEEFPQYFSQNIITKFELTLLDKHWYVDCKNHNLLANFSSNEIAPLENFKKFLGIEFNSIIIFFDQLNINLLLSISETLTQSGTIFIIIKNKLNSSLEDYILYCANYFNISIVPKEKIITLINSLNITNTKLSNSNQLTKAPFNLSNEQQLILDFLYQSILNKNNFHTLITGVRGSGKTTLMLKLINFLKIQNFKINFSVLNSGEGSLFKKYQFENIPSLTYQNFINFILSTDVLIIEEAASIPLPILSQILSVYKKVIMISTLDGYEGTNQGIIHKLSTDFPLEIFSLSYNFRRNYDNFQKFLENISFKANNINFSTYSSLQSSSINIISNNISQNINSLTIHLSSFIEKPNNESISLLIKINKFISNNHYQSSNQDIFRLLNDPNTFVSLLLKNLNYEDYSLKNSEIISLVIFSLEAIPNKILKESIFNGSSRPKNNLLPQTLLCHSNIDFPDNSIFLRIQRIATEKSYKKQGYASKLLSNFNDKNLINFFIQNSTFSKDFSCDCSFSNHLIFIGASFALSDVVYKFWIKNNFIPVSLGLKKDNASGERSLVVLKNFYNNTKIAKWHNNFINFKLPILIQRHKLFKESQILNLKNYTSIYNLIKSYIDFNLITLENYKQTNSFKVICSIALYNHSVEHSILELFTFYFLYQYDIKEYVKQKQIFSSYFLFKRYLYTSNQSFLEKKFAIQGKKVIHNSIRQFLKELIENLKY